MSRRVSAFSFHLPAWLNEAVAKYAASKGIPKAEYVKDAIKMAVETDRKQHDNGCTLEETLAKVGVHQKHCCKRHGCKHGEADCPVVTGVAEQSFPCEECLDGE